jgi:hypothetical protein
MHMGISNALRTFSAAITLGAIACHSAIPQTGGSPPADPELAPITLEVDGVLSEHDGQLFGGHSIVELSQYRDPTHFRYASWCEVDPTNGELHVEFQSVLLDTTQPVEVLIAPVSAPRVAHLQNRAALTAFEARRFENSAYVATGPQGGGHHIQAGRVAFGLAPQVGTIRIGELGEGSVSMFVHSGNALGKHVQATGAPPLPLQAGATYDLYSWEGKRNWTAYGFNDLGEVVRETRFLRGQNLQLELETPVDFTIVIPGTARLVALFDAATYEPLVVPSTAGASRREFMANLRLQGVLQARFRGTSQASFTAILPGTYVAEVWTEDAYAAGAPTTVATIQPVTGTSISL